VRADLLSRAPGAAVSEETDDILRASFADLADDFEELAWLLRSGAERVRLSLEDVDGAAAHIPRRSRLAVGEHARLLLSRSMAAGNELDSLGEAAATGSLDLDKLARLTERKRVLADLVRTQQALAASLITATDWQSPSFAHAVHSIAGRYTGKIDEHQTDYKRDRHSDAKAFEEAYLAEYVDNPHGHELRAVMTNCGMAAFTTVLDYLRLEDRIRRDVFVGRSLYHECKALVASAFGSRVREFDEADTEGAIRLIDQAQPGAVFVDSLCNAKGILVPDLQSLTRQLIGRGNPTYLVIDNTGLSCAFQQFLEPSLGSLRPIVIESLTKYAQFGLDHATAGMIVCLREDADALDAYREHLGTNVTDTSVHVIPWPGRRLLERRLARLERNSMLLASHSGGLGGRAVSGVAYPGLPSHPSHQIASLLPFRGGFLEIEFAEPYDRVDMHRRFVREALLAASERGVPLTAGASFGLNTTRIYNTASTSSHGRPFVRLCAGTEHRLGVEGLREAFAIAANRLATRGD
jgi:cystathionine beta-lyase/cystathionine gamma-synthase